MADITNLYVLEIFITSGPVSEEFIKQNPVISRTLEMLGNQTLEELHYAIFNAFNREDDHMYEFQLGGKGPNDPNATQYGLPTALEDANDLPKSERDVARTSLDNLNLKVGDIFGYWFDFGDDWWHQINVTSVGQSSLAKGYPKVTNRVGASPPQYMA